jgi:hypothetical protein
MIWDCINRYKRLYLEEREKYLIVKAKNERIMRQLIKSQELLNKCVEIIEEMEKIKSLK